MHGVSPGFCIRRHVAYRLVISASAERGHSIPPRLQAVYLSPGCLQRLGSLGIDSRNPFESVFFREELRMADTAGFLPRKGLGCLRHVQRWVGGMLSLPCLN